MGSPTAAAIYARISQDRTGEGPGVARQETDCNAWAERCGWAVAETYVDDDLSAFSGRARPAYQRLLADIDCGRRDGLIVWHPDRLHRSPRELEDFIDLVERTGVTVATVTAGEYDLSTCTGRMTARIVGSVARGESEHKAERIRRKQEDMASSGQYKGGGRRAFGYEKDGVTIREEEAALIRDAAARVLAGDSVRSVMTDWKRSGVSTVSGSPWSQSTITRILLGSRIVGKRKHRGEVVGDALWPAIIDEKTSARIKARLNTRDRREPQPRKYLLAGMMYCGGCGARMTSRPTPSGVRRYVCVEDRGGCNKVGIAAEHLEELVAEAVFIRLDSPEFVAAVKARRNSSEVDEDELLDAIRADEDALNELAGDYYKERIISRPEFLAARSKLESRLADRRVQLTESHRSTVTLTQAGSLVDLRSEWTAFDLARRRSVVDSLVDRIVIAPSSRPGRFDPARVDVIWRA